MCAEEQHNTIWVMGKLCYSATQWPTFMYWHRHCAEHCETRTMKCPQTISIKYRNKTAFCTCRTHEKEIVYWSMACIHQSPVSSQQSVSHSLCHTISNLQSTQCAAGCAPHSLNITFFSSNMCLLIGSYGYSCMSVVKPTINIDDSR